MSRWRTTIPDDRSPPRPVPLWWPTKEEIDGRSDLPKHVYRIIAPHTTIGLFRHIRRREWITLGIMTLPTLALVFVIKALGFNDWAARVAYFVAVMGAIVLLQSIAIRRERQRIREAILAAHRCASCGYSLADLPVTPDGLTVCPECDAAWRLPT